MENKRAFLQRQGPGTSPSLLPGDKVTGLSRVNLQGQVKRGWSIPQNLGVEPLISKAECDHYGRLLIPRSMIHFPMTCPCPPVPKMVLTTPVRDFPFTMSTNWMAISSPQRLWASLVLAPRWGQLMTFSWSTKARFRGGSCRERHSLLSP